MSKELSAVGTLTAAVHTAQGHYRAGIFSDDDDSKGRFYVDLEHKFPTADSAVSYAKAAAANESYRQWDDGYECQIFQRQGEPVPLGTKSPRIYR